MTPAARREYVRAVRPRYTLAPWTAKPRILDEFCATTGYQRKYAITLLNAPQRTAEHPRRRRPFTYPAPVITILAAIWEAAGYPWSTRLHALLPLWLPWARRHFAISPKLERQMRTISPRTIDRRLQARKRQVRQPPAQSPPGLARGHGPEPSFPPPAPPLEQRLALPTPAVPTQHPESPGKNLNGVTIPSRVRCFNGLTGDRRRAR